MPPKTTRKLHAIQLDSVRVIELFIRSNQRPEHTTQTDTAQLTLTSSHSPHDPEKKELRVIVGVEIGMGRKPATPFSMKIQLIGFFAMDDSKFDLSQLDDWADRNAPLIVYPFLREHAFALSARCGFSPVILPLVQVPTLIPKPREKKPESGRPPV
jgi:preprotein translocase subunit SecB